MNLELRIKLNNSLKIRDGHFDNVNRLVEGGRQKCPK